MDNKQHEKPVYRLIGRSGGAKLDRVGFHSHFITDAYHFLLKSNWLFLFLILTLIFFLLNAAFAGLYLLQDGGIEAARSGSFADAFFFSVQTMATLGYGKMAPVGLYANILATLEVFFGLLGLALATGLIFSKFSRPTARVLFSKVALIAPRDGVNSLVFRMANARTNQIVEAHMKLTVLLNETTKEGVYFRRFHDMKLMRDYSPVFGLTWLAVHPIDQESPLFGKTAADLMEAEAEIVVSFSGIDDTFLATVHKQYSYLPEEILWAYRFEDIIIDRDDGSSYIDYRRFHEVRPL